jgi:hypothetical protein
MAMYPEVTLQKQRTTKSVYVPYEWGPLHSERATRTRHHETHRWRPSVQGRTLLRRSQDMMGSCVCVGSDTTKEGCGPLGLFGSDKFSQ